MNPFFDRIILVNRLSTVLKYLFMKKIHFYSNIMRLKQIIVILWLCVLLFSQEVPSDQPARCGFCEWVGGWVDLRSMPDSLAWASRCLCSICSLRSAASESVLASLAPSSAASASKRSPRAESARLHTSQVKCVIRTHFINGKPAAHTHTHTYTYSTSRILNQIIHHLAISSNQ